ncbi:MAG: hypothetical protein ABIQ95_09595 [Bdellovibrionia bacterium]
MRNVLKLPVAVLLALLLSSCASTPAKPCSLGGQPPRAGPAVAAIGKKSCYQISDDSGGYLNNGKYYEWYLNDKIAIVGEYKKGKKSGRWIEYDESGKTISQHEFENGLEVPSAYEIKK